MDIFGRKQPGTWYLSSKSDPRWNCQGDVEDLVLTDGTRPEALKAIEENKEKYGKPPDDLYYQAWKD